MAAPKTVLITGANRGIGLAFAAHYVSSGWNVVASARNVDTADEVRTILRMTPTTSATLQQELMGTLAANRCAVWRTHTALGVCA